MESKYAEIETVSHKIDILISISFKHVNRQVKIP